jgi:hypothetical protein
MIDLTSETLISLSEAARLLPRGRRNRPVTLSCVLRWVLDGVRLPSGSAVRLQAVRMGGRWLTSKEALQRFADAQTPRLDGQPEQPAPRAPSARQRDSERAAAALEKVGI